MLVLKQKEAYKVLLLQWVVPGAGVCEVMIWHGQGPVIWLFPVL